MFITFTKVISNQIFYLKTFVMVLSAKKSRVFILSALLLFISPMIKAADGAVPSIGGIRIEFILFAITLIGVAVFHHKTMYVALDRISCYSYFQNMFSLIFQCRNILIGTATKEGEWRILLNLIGLLFGFAILAEHFKESRFPEILPNYLPGGWKGGFVLLFFITILSSFLDNIAAAMIGGAIAMVVFKGKVHIGFLAAIVAASNAGGAGSVVGDTTTTLMWIDGVNPLDVLHAFVASFTALAIFGVIAAVQQDRYQPIIVTAIKCKG